METEENKEKKDAGDMIAGVIGAIYQKDTKLTIVELKDGRYSLIRMRGKNDIESIFFDGWHPFIALLWITIRLLLSKGIGLASLLENISDNFKGDMKQNEIRFNEINLECKKDDFSPNMN